MPEEPERQVPGTLTFDKDAGIRLQLHGGFDRHKMIGGMIGTAGPVWPTLILGRTENGSDMTLYQTYPVRFSGSYSEFRALYLLAGAHLRSESELAFSSMRINFTHLEEWLGYAPFKSWSIYSDVPIKPHAGDLEGIRAEVPAIDSVLEFYSALDEGGDEFRSYYAEQRMFISIQSHKRRSFGWYTEVVEDFRELLTLFTWQPIYPNAIEAVVHRGPDVKRLERVWVVADPWLQVHTHTRYPFDHSHIPVPLRLIQAKLSDVLQRWFADREHLRPVRDLFFQTMYSEYMYPQSEFLGLMQALETYHSRTRDGKYLPDEEYKPLRDAIMVVVKNTVRGKLRQRLLSSIKFGNQYTLRTRVEEILDGLSAPLRDHVTDRPSGAFIDMLVENRNYLTHYGKPPKDGPLDPAGLRTVSEHLRLLLAILMLLQIGLDESEVRYADSLINLRSFRKRPARED